MKSCNYIIIIICFVILAGCNTKTSNKNVVSKNSATSSVSNITGVDVEPGLEGVDSLQILYYDNPDGDSLRYTRFFKYVNVIDSSFISALKNELKQPFNKKKGMIPCRSEGKMYLYSKQAVIKTVYFSTRCESCCHLFFISNGSFIYFDLTGPFSERLKTLRGKAEMP